MPRHILFGVVYSCLCVAVGGQNFDFENGIADWQQQGSAFRGQPYCQEISSTVFAVSKLGGHYWRDLKYPLGQSGRCLMTTIVKPAGSTPSAITSPAFMLDRRNRYWSFRIGGSEDLMHERLELEVLTPAGEEAALMVQVRAWWQRVPSLALPVGASLRDGAYVIAAGATGHNSDRLRQDVVELPDFLMGLTARVRVLDDVPAGHINVDMIRFTAVPPPDLRVPVWGFADYHTHPMSYMGFGGMKGIPTLWGIPGGGIEEYDDPTAISRDIPYCTRGHHGGPFSEAFINGSPLLHYDFGSILGSILFPHKRRGGPEFDNFPDHLMGAHQQMHVTQIRRSYDGGLRLMVALATDNLAAQFLTGKVQHGHIDLVQEKASIEAQLAGMKQWAAKNSAWMAIAYSAAEARRIILHNKLAVILGVEVDQLGDIALGTEENLEPQREADWLWGLGARAVIPIHAVNNKLGSPAVFIEPYNWLNDLIHRENKDATIEQVQATKPQYFAIDEDRATCDPRPAAKRGECVLGGLGAWLEQRTAIGHPPTNWFRPSPAIFGVVYVKDYDTAYGQKNHEGLEDFGRRYIGALMNRGLIIDTAHMSDKSVEGVYAEIGKRLAQQHPGCDNFSFRTDAAAECNADAYPAIISHAHFRGQALYGNTKLKEYLPNEYDISDRNLVMVSRVGGVVGPFVAEPRIDPDAPYSAPGIGDDCGNSSKNFAHSFHYAATIVNTEADRANGISRVGIATDMTFIPMVSPRFGPHACDGATLFKNGKAERRAHPERYETKQSHPVFYRIQTGGAGEPADDPALEPYRMGQRIFDFNQDGLAHYGLLPDMLEDLYQLGDQDLDTLFRSAEGYLQMWEKVERLGGTITQERR